MLELYRMLPRNCIQKWLFALALFLELDYTFDSNKALRILGVYCNQSANFVNVPESLHMLS